MEQGWQYLKVGVLLSSLIYALLGMGLFVVAIILMEVVTPFSLRKEIEEDQNTALAIVMGAFLIGMAIIIQAAIT